MKASLPPVGALLAAPLAGRATHRVRGRDCRAAPVARHKQRPDDEPSPAGGRSITDHPLAIELTHLTGGYGGEPVVRDVSLRVPVGRFVGLVGPSGAGKTSLLRAMLGALPRVGGEVRVGGRPVAPGSPPAGVAYVPQVDAVDWTFPVTVDDVVQMGRVRRTGPWPWPSREDRRQTAATLDRLGIGGLGRRQIRELSGGQQGRVFLARALVARPAVLLLDEPTASVDPKTRDDVLRLLAELNHNGITIVITTHELNAVAAHLPWVVCVNGGLIAQGPPAEVFTGETLSRTFGAPMRVVRDPETGDLLVAEASSRQPSAVSRQEEHASLLLAVGGSSR